MDDKRYTQHLLLCRQINAVNCRNEQGHVKPRVFWSSENTAIRDFANSVVVAKKSLPFVCNDNQLDIQFQTAFPS
jgi:hypothetical protein